MLQRIEGINFIRIEIFPFPGIPGTNFSAFIISSPHGVRFQSRPHEASEFLWKKYVCYYM